MKIKLIALMLALTIISQTLQLGLVTGISGDPAPQTEETVVPQAEGEDDGNLGSEIPTPPTNPIDLIGTEEIEWCYYEEFLFRETEYAWDDPMALVGATATFNFDYIDQFVFASDTSVAFEEYHDGDEGYATLLPSDLVDANGKSIKVTVTDYIINKTDDTTGDYWVKIEAAEGYTLPETIKNYPYMLYAIYQGDIPSLLVEPQLAKFADDVVTVFDATFLASPSITVDAVLLNEVFEIDRDKLSFNSLSELWYDLGDLTHIEGVDDPAYRYIPEEALVFIPTAVSRVYDALVSANGTIQFNNILNNVPTELISKIPLSLKDEIIDYSEELVRLESIEKTATVTYNGIPLNVTVNGKIPETGVTLSVAPVGEFALSAEGFKFDEGEEIITALDIKLINDVDGTQWQPEENYPVEVSIEMTPLGIEEGRVLTLRHKHEDKISKNDVFVVMDGKLTAVTGGFSIYVVSAVGQQNNLGKQIANNGSDTLYVGQSVIYYFGDSGNNGTWNVVDTSGAIHYTVHGNETNSTSIGHNRLTARWIKIVALKTTETPITLQYSYRTNDTNITTQTFSLNINIPQAESGSKKLYIKDIVNSTGCIEAALSDENGKDISEQLEGAAFSWKRDDGLFIVPQAYEENYSRVNIARDHGGLVEARKNADGSAYKPTTYTLKVILADGTEHTATYTVYYQSEIINSNFEFPKASTSNYSFFPNGYPELYWKTTAPGSTAPSNKGANITKDIEYGNVTNQTANANDGTDFGVIYAADHEDGGVQFAELNAEAFGTLYQDIISVPGEDIEWKFAHAPRRRQDWATDITNRMFLVMGATEDAQKLTSQSQLQALCNLARSQNIQSGGDPVTVTYNGATYRVWYHDAGEVERNQGNDKYYSEEQNYGWTNLAGEYKVPDGQYRTRLFFVSDPPQGNNSPNAGNLIDKSKAGQYNDYLIEYYVEEYNPSTGKIELKLYTTESGSALIYSSVALKYYDELISEKFFYLYKILINDEIYPYDIRYASNPDDPDAEGKAQLYIEKYPGIAKDPLNNNSSEQYKGKDIVMQVFMRDTVVAIQKEIILPNEMTEEQKLTLMNNLIETQGKYSAEFLLHDENKVYREIGSAVITSRDPAGKYKGFVSLGKDLVIQGLDGNHQDILEEYWVEETDTTELEGLVLSTVTFKVQRYAMGAKFEQLIEESYSIKTVENGVPIVTDPILLGGKVKIADIEVINAYEEKETTIIYHAIGNGKIKSNKAGSVFEDAPSETLKYYSGKSIGCSTHSGVGATFVGWFKDEACTIPVTAADGVVGADGSFKPNANILNADVVHFYAKFDTCNIVIERENAEPGKTFVYEVIGPDKTGIGKITTYVTVTCGADGKGSTTIYEATKGTYTVKELDGWSWRYDPGEPQTKTHPKDALSMTFTFDSNPSDTWLDGFSEPEKNVYGKAKVN